MSQSTTENILPPCDLLVRADVIVTQDNDRRVLTSAGVAVKDGNVLEVDDYATLETRYIPVQRLDLSGKMLMPGLVNGHTHLPMTLLRGFADDLPLMDWLENHIWPLERHLNDDLLAVGARLGCAEFIRTGCTSFLNGYFNEYVTGQIVSDCGLRAVLGEGFFSFPSPMFSSAEDCWKTLRELNKRFENHPRVRTAVTPHAAFTVAPDDLVASFELAERLDIPWQIHLAESPTETAVCLGKYGKRPVELLQSLGLLTPRTTLHHCVDVTDGEIEILADGGVNVVHNPGSNLKLCSGLSPVQKMLDAGITVGLGTDGASSNNQLNMFRDMALAALIGKIRHNDASAVNAQTALDMATRNSAKCLGWPELGRIEAGYAADMIALDLSSPNLMPVFNYVSHAVYAATGLEVCMTMVAGEILYLYGEYRTMDVKSLRDEAFQCTQWALETARK
ncbi:MULTISPECIES: amidohydrolase [unclassified Pseudodesulfovibrio]|uniref:amidohydrolase n=1 Tax=unclassified Pseudodesulfovibrio TaxID=2661612 RepID=UPI000FEC026A|nr:MULTISPECIES: amidohydrolase [unclassified Pseudodesulfovibrio]MCJ2163898.1 amidohydrolase [Pseudodesulfovibrio sp. S3-i]RWU05857.1 amidohydrolase [Pseudodesulfovibrio sp. S3]